MGRDDITLTFEPPAAPISMNEGDSWKVRGSAKEWRDRAYWAWCERHPGVGPSGRGFGVAGEVHVVLPFPDNRRRDPINYAKTVKHIVDGLVQAGAWPDDTLDFVTQHIPVLRKGDQVIVRVHERQEEPTASPVDVAEAVHARAQRPESRGKSRERSPRSKRGSKPPPR